MIFQFRNNIAVRLFFLIFLSAALYPAAAQKLKSLSSAHYHVHYTAEFEQTAGEVLEIAEIIWPTLARAYKAHDNYIPIDIFLADPGDYANGNAIYPFSRVYIYLAHLNTVMRGRRNWLGNVLTHEISHVFSLRNAAYLSPFDAVMLQGGTINQKRNYSFSAGWTPMVIPTWYVEGVAQLEADEHGYDTWDSQRDMIVRDAYLTQTIPTLGELETFDRWGGDWISFERIYNTGYGFLRFLREQYGMDKVRRLTYPKPVFNFTWSAQSVFGKSLEALYGEWLSTMEADYRDYRELPQDELYLSSGSYNHSLAFSNDGKYAAWIGNDFRAYQIDWIYWKKTGSGEVHKASAGGNAEPGDGGKIIDGRSALPGLRPASAFTEPGIIPETGLGMSARIREPPSTRSAKFGAAGLMFNRDATRLLTTRQPAQGQYFDTEENAPFRDIWEYGFLEDKWHRLTWHERAGFATYHPDKNLILFVRGGWGASMAGGSGNIALLDSAGRIHQLTNFREGQQVYNPRFTPAGDSIYFTLGIEEKEAIVSIPANAPPFDLFASLRDSVFPDSLLLADSLKLTFITSLDSNLDRDLSFSGDTLFWSSYYGDRVYNVFARIPGDSVIYRATHVRTGALEPLVHDGHLYYQGYEHQHFNLFRKPLELTPTAYIAGSADTLPTLRKKKLKYTDAFETGEYRGKGIAWDITPGISIWPQFVDDTTIITNLGLGVEVSLGELTSYVQHTFEARISNNFEWRSPANYHFSYQGLINQPAFRHTRFSWMPQINYALGRYVFNSRQETDTRREKVLNIFPDSAFRYNPIFNVDEPIAPFIAPYYVIAETLAVADGSLYPVRDTLMRDIHEISTYTSTYDNASAGMALPLGLFTLGHYLRYQADIKREGLALTYRDTDWPDAIMPPQGMLDSAGVSRAEIDSFLLGMYTDSANLELRTDGTPQYRHYSQSLGWQKSFSKMGAYLPTGFGMSFLMSKYWIRYASNSFLLDQDSWGCAIDEAACQTIHYQYAAFSPWEFSARFAGAWSHEKLFTLSASSDFAFFSEDFPRFDPADKDPHGNLFYLYHRLGNYRLPAYPYNFIYGGRNILKGTSMAAGNVALQFPFKINRYFDSPWIPFSSLRQISLTFAGDAGTVLSTAPDRIITALNNGENELLFDYGARLSFNFLVYHRYPMTLYAQCFIPWNQLREEAVLNSDIPPLDYDGNGFPEVYTITGYSAGNDFRVGRKAYFENVKTVRWFFGLVLGSF